MGVLLDSLHSALALRPVAHDHLLESRQMQALSFTVHIPLVCFGIAFPVPHRAAAAPTALICDHPRWCASYALAPIAGRDALIALAIGPAVRADASHVIPRACCSRPSQPQGSRMTVLDAFDLAGCDDAELGRRTT